MSTRTYLEIRDKRDGSVVFCEQIMGNNYSLSDAHYSRLGVAPDGDGCFDKTEICLSKLYACLLEDVLGRIDTGRKNAKEFEETDPFDLKEMLLEIQKADVEVREGTSLSVAYMKFHNIAIDTIYLGSQISRYNISQRFSAYLEAY